jgi:hypothetical protein
MRTEQRMEWTALTGGPTDGSQARTRLRSAPDGSARRCSGSITYPGHVVPRDVLPQGLPSIAPAVLTSAAWSVRAVPARSGCTSRMRSRRALSISSARRRSIRPSTAYASPGPAVAAWELVTGWS